MDNDPARDPTRVTPESAGPELEGPATETAAGAPAIAASGDLLQRPDIGGRGNGPVRVAAMQRLQRALGARRAQRYLQRRAAPTAIQRDGSALPPVPDVHLTTPSLLQPPDPAARYHLGGDEHLHLDPAVQAMVTTGVRQQIDPTALSSALAGVRLGPMPAGGAPNALSGPPTPTPAPLVTPGAGPATPHAGGGSDIMDALLGIHVIDQAVTTAQTRVLEQITVDWSRLRTPERIGVVSTVAVIGLGALGGAMTDPDARKFLIGQLNGRVLPVPGVDWLHLEVNTGGDNLMLGLHVDVGRLLPPILGFGPGSPSAIGGPPQPQPFVPGQRKAAGAAADSSGAPDLAGRIAAAAGGGSPLQTHVQRRLESGLGADLSGVRVHTGGEADALAGAVDAVAFTTGSNIFFRSGEYNPDTEAGLGLLAHEAAHTIQQAAGPVAGTARPGGVAVSDPSDSFEQAADQAAAAVLAGATTAPAGAGAAAPAGAVQRQADPNRAGAAFDGLENRGPIVAQRNITGFLLGASGTLSINMQDQQDVPSGSGTRTGVSGTITYSPDPEGPYSNKIGLIQVIKVTKEKGADVDIASLPTAYGPRLRTKEDTAAGVEGGYYTDILHNDFTGSGKDRPEKSAASPYYEFGPSGPTKQIFGYRRSEKAADIKDAEIGDFPATGSKTDNIDWAFETVAKADDTQQVFGAAKWGFGVHADKIVNEHVDFFPGQSATFDAAMEKHREFYTHEPVTFYFDFNSATPNATELAKIDEFLPYVTRLTDVRLNIQGFADEKGDAAANEAISRRRADAIATAIRGRGVDNARLTIAAPGGATTSFTADATTTPQSAEANRRGNRRVMVTFERGPAAGP